MKVAIVHDWIVSYGGGEKVVLKLHQMFPEAPIYTSVYDKKKMEKYFGGLDIRTSFIQKLPFGIRKYRYYLPLMPVAFEQFDLTGYDLVISSSSCCSKGVNVEANTTHICYCHTPMRYAWDMYNKYNRGNFLKRMIVTWQMHKLRQWDYISSNRVDCFLANSKNVEKRINKHYRREANVLYPPIDKEFYEEYDESHYTNKNYLLVTRFVSYKKVELVIRTFNELGLPLMVVGDGPERRKLLKIAKDNITFKKVMKKESLIEEYRNCRAFVFMAEEDFGMVMAEARSLWETSYCIQKRWSIRNCNR